MPGISKSNETKFFEYLYCATGKHVLDNILQIDELSEKSLMIFINQDELSDDENDGEEVSCGSLEIKLADLDKDHFVQFASEVINFSNTEGAVLIKDMEIYSSIQELHLNLKSGFEENLQKCVTKCWGKYKEF